MQKKIQSLTLVLWGFIPSKKNLYRSHGSRRFKDAKLSKQIEDLEWQITGQAGNIAPFIRPAIKAHFVCKDYRSDLDNKWTCIQDALVSTGLLKDDNLKHLCGPIVITGTKGEPERVTIRIVGGQGVKR